VGIRAGQGAGRAGGPALSAVRYNRNKRVTVGQAGASSLPPMPETLRGRVTVYRFRSVSGGQIVSPQRMWGTPEAIATLPDCELITGSGRLVHRKLLEEGFFFEQVNSAYISIEEAEGA